MNFEVSLSSLLPSSNLPGAPITLELVFRNTTNRVAHVLNYHLEIWLDPSGSRSAPAEFLGELLFDIQSASTSGGKLVAEFQPQQQATMRFLWHQTPASLQRIEKVRNGGPVHLDLRGQLLVSAIWTGQTAAVLDWEAFRSPIGQWPYRLPISPSSWVELLNQIQFRHILIHEINWPAFPISWKRSESSLREAWSHHRHGKYEEAMLSCRRALECIAVCIVGDPKANREVVVAQLFATCPADKQKRIQELWGSIQDFLNVAVHNQGQPMSWNVEDSEVCLLCTTALLAYLAGV